jgi:NADPH-dependent curcumin reductase CurA
MNPMQICLNGISEDRIKLKESIFEGLENAPKAFVSLFRGDTMGRTLVRFDSVNEIIDKLFQ